jgi:hypothetical protein
MNAAISRLDQCDRPVFDRWTCPTSRINQLKRNRAVATRYDKLAVRYLATVRIATLAEWLR